MDCLPDTCTAVAICHPFRRRRARIARHRTDRKAARCSSGGPLQQASERVRRWAGTGDTDDRDDEAGTRHCQLVEDDEWLCVDLLARYCVQLAICFRIRTLVVTATYTAVVVVFVGTTTSG